MPPTHMAVTAVIVLPLYVKTGYTICISMSFSEMDLVVSSHPAGENIRSMI